MATDVFSNPREEDPLDVALFQGERRKIIQPTSLLDPKVEKLKDVLTSWINKTLTPDHIVVQSLDEDLFDGLVLHHLLARLAGVSLSVDEIAVTAAAQIHKLGVVLEEVNKRLGLTDDALAKWNVQLIHNKDLLATIHLLVTMVRHFQPDLALPPNVKVEVVLVEVTKTGIKSDIQSEDLTEESLQSPNSSSGEDPIEKLLTLDAHKILLAKTFSDGVILLLLIGQLEGFFIPLCDFHLSPANHAEMVHNVTLACDFLLDIGLNVPNIDPEDIISRDVGATLKVLYALFRRHKGKHGESAASAQK
ncbi:gamma-parvin isoform X2 [Gadus morhua]|uniref:gamma-parvin isoform X2 n=1 Tax=Gadus morhua TaxID=8049 RepID=UPI0011B6AE40|nr:gamma-parvin isoform X2 [Gadus morhua]